VVSIGSVGDAYDTRAKAFRTIDDLELTTLTGALVQTTAARPSTATTSHPSRASEFTTLTTDPSDRRSLKTESLRACRGGSLGPRA
jgi:hypothetical protein